MLSGAGLASVIPSAEPRDEEISAAAERITAWLLSGSVQANASPYPGGVAGWLEADGSASFAYGEITGYWLSWLSGIAGRDGVAERAAAAVKFLDSAWSGTAPPPTRLYPAAAPPDWRNRAVFSFDMAMVLRGLAHAAELIEPDACAAVAQRILPWMARCIGSDGTFMTHVPVGAGGPLPCRWSTQPGPFQAKAAAAVLQVPSAWLPDAVARAARATLARCAGGGDRYSELHPRLYTLEGEVLAGGRVDPGLAGTRIAADGRLPEDEAEAAGTVRADVLAQSIRLLTLVDGAGVAPARARAAVVAGALLDHVTAEGSVLFRRGSGPRNTWCAIFAAQALAWLAAATAGRPIDRSRLV